MARKNYESTNLRFAKNALPPHSALLIECRFVQLKTLCQRTAGLSWHNISWVKVNSEGAFFIIKFPLIVFYTLYHIENSGSKKKERMLHQNGFEPIVAEGGRQIQQPPSMGLQLLRQIFDNAL